MTNARLAVLAIRRRLMLRELQGNRFGLPNPTLAGGAPALQIISRSYAREKFPRIWRNAIAGVLTE